MVMKERRSQGTVIRALKILHRKNGLGGWGNWVREDAF